LLVFRIICAGLTGFVLLVPVGAAETLRSAAERTAACLEITDSNERLACLETSATALSGILKEAQDTAPVAAPVTAAAVPDTPEWAAPPEPEPEPESDDEKSGPIWARVFGGDKKDGSTVDSVSISVTRILRNSTGRHFFLTADGQEWEQTSREPVNPPKGLPAAATIEETMLGSPLLTFDDGPTGAYRVRRVK